jgi:hypothetical protein
MAIDTAQLAGMLASDRAFREWVTTWLTTPELATVEEAAQFIRYVCEIKSRAELATNEEAARRFHELLRRPFIAWRNARHRNK